MKKTFLEIELEDNAQKIIEKVSELYAQSNYKDLAPVSQEFYNDFVAAISLSQTIAGEIHTDWSGSSVRYLLECKSIGVFSFRIRCLLASIDEIVLSKIALDQRYIQMEKVSCVALLGMEAAARHTASQIAHSLLHSELIPTLRNRKALAKDFDSSIKFAQLLTVAYIDMDGLKALNDSKNHAAGDAALQGLGEEIRICCKENQTAYHFSGDEFGILATDQDIDQLVAQLEELLVRAQHKFSYGIASGPITESLDKIVNKADEEMQIQKKGRRAQGVANLR